MNAPTPAAHLAPEVTQRTVPEAFLAALKARFGNNCSTALVVRDEGSGVRSYCHIGTGNYNAKTAKLYEDLGILTADPLLPVPGIFLYPAALLLQGLSLLLRPFLLLHFL